MNDRKALEGCAGAFLIMLGLLVACGGGGIAMMPEGPHGPNGEITGDPGNGLRCLICFLIGGTMVVLGILASKNPKDQDRWQKRD